MIIMSYYYKITNGNAAVVFANIVQNIQPPSLRGQILGAIQGFSKSAQDKPDADIKGNDAGTWINMTPNRNFTTTERNALDVATVLTIQT